MNMLQDVKQYMTYNDVKHVATVSKGGCLACAVIVYKYHIQKNCLHMYATVNRHVLRYMILFPAVIDRLILTS